MVHHAAKDAETAANDWQHERQGCDEFESAYNPVSVGETSKKI